MNDKLLIRSATPDVYDRARESHKAAEEATKMVFEQESPFMQVVAAAVFVGAIVLGVLGVQDDK